MNIKTKKETLEAPKTRAGIAPTPRHMTLLSYASESKAYHWRTEAIKPLHRPSSFMRIVKTAKINKN